jgi:hypothetical protein
MNRSIKAAFAGLCVTVLAGCVTAPARKDYAELRTESPRSILVVPAVNKSVDVDAPDYFLSTVATADCLII